MRLGKYIAQTCQRIGRYSRNAHRSSTPERSWLSGMGRQENLARRKHRHDLGLIQKQMMKLTMQVREFSPMKESRSTWVNLLARKGKWAPLRPRARMHSFKARRLLLISAPSILTCLLALIVSAPLSFPARSMSEYFPFRQPFDLCKNRKLAEQIKIANNEGITSSSAIFERQRAIVRNFGWPMSDQTCVCCFLR